MKRARVVALVLAAVLFLLALGMHIASFVEPASLLGPGQVVSQDSMILVSAAILAPSIAVWFAGLMMTDLGEPQSKAGGQTWLDGIATLVRLLARIPLWMNLAFVGFVVYLYLRSTRSIRPPSMLEVDTPPIHLGCLPAYGKARMVARPGAILG
jgi:hypothetical protein